jgi:hypothetical protein
MKDDSSVSFGLHLPAVLMDGIPPPVHGCSPPATLELQLPIMKAHKKEMRMMVFVDPPQKYNATLSSIR